MRLPWKCFSALPIRSVNTWRRTSKTRMVTSAMMRTLINIRKLESACKIERVQFAADLERSITKMNSKLKFKNLRKFRRTSVSKTQDLLHKMRYSKNN